MEGFQTIPYQESLEAVIEQAQKDAHSGDWSYKDVQDETTQGAKAEFRAVEAFNKKHIELERQPYKFSQEDIDNVRNAYIKAFDEVIRTSPAMSAGKRRKTRSRRRRHKRRPTHRKLRR